MAEGKAQGWDEKKISISIVSDIVFDSLWEGRSEEGHNTGTGRKKDTDWHEL